MKSFFLDQHGCAKNQVDGELLASQLQNAGYVMAEDPAEADLIIVNSCGFIESAKQESLESLMGARAAFPNSKILLAGCLAERYADVFKKDLPEANGIFGNGDLSKIVEVVNDIFADQRPVVKPEQKGVCCGARNLFLNYKGSAFVKITEGCDNRCTFCAIPIIRGNLRSRKVSEIVEEITSLVNGGIKEINLIGQDLAAYGCGKDDDVFGNGKNHYDLMYRQIKKPLFVENPTPEEKSFLSLLMEEISKIKGDFWVRLLYIHPDHFNADILNVMKKDSRFLPYFDIPFQSGDDTIIRAMNRKGSFDSYRNLVDSIRTTLGDSCIRTTFLTGFPGEDKNQAANTKEFLKAIRSDWSGCFPYSKEEDTPAASIKAKDDKKASQKRADELTAIQGEITAESLRARVGKTYRVLVEEIVENADAESDEGLAIGRSWFQAPEVDGSFVIRYDLDDKNAVAKIIPGNFVSVKALNSSDVDIDGMFVDGE